MNHQQPSEKPQLHFDEDAAIVTEQPQKQPSKKPMIIGWIVGGIVVLAALIMGVLALVGVFDKDETPPASQQQEEVPTIDSAAELAGDWTVTVDAGTLARLLREETDDRAAWVDQAVDGLGWEQETVNVLMPVIEEVLAEQTITVAMHIDENGKTTLSMTEQEMTALVGGLCDRAATIVKDKERFYACARAFLAVETDEEVDEFLAEKQWDYQTLCMLMNGGIIKTVVGGYIQTLAADNGYYDETTMMYVTPTVVPNIQKGRWYPLGSAVGIKLELDEKNGIVIDGSDVLVEADVSDTTKKRLQEALGAVTIKRVEQTQSEQTTAAK